VRGSFVALAAATAALVAACAAPNSGAQPGASVRSPTPASPTNPAVRASSAPLMVTDALGRKVLFESVPQRIAVVGKALFMVTSAAYLFPEASSRVVALGSTGQTRPDFVSVIDPAYAHKTILDGQAGPEQIAATRPDLVLLKSSNADTLGQPLQTLGIKVVYVDLETPEQYTRDLAILGQVFQDSARAQQLIAFYQQKTQSVTAALAGLRDDQKPRVLIINYTDKNGTVAFTVPPLGWIQTTEVQLAGGQPVWKGAQLGKGWTTVTLEQIAAWDPDQVYVVAYGSDTRSVVSKLKADPQWAALRAVKQGQIHGFPADFYSWDQPDTRWILGLTWLATKIHPDYFPGLDMKREIADFFRTLYGMDDAAYERDIVPKLTGDLP
jgi:iron complex transport system substrate-binding protein